MTPRLVVCTSLAIALLCGLTSATSAQAPDSQAAPSLTVLRGNLYLARVDWRTTVVLATQDGLVVGDPISEEGAAWLRAELATRFPGQRVRYVLQSHHHFDRARGASVFDGAETIGHRLFNVELRQARGSELYRDVAPVKRTFDVRERLVVGGRRVELIHTGPAHAPDMSALYFPDERVLFDVAPPAIDVVPFVFGPYASPQDIVRWLTVVSALDIDVIVGSEGRTFDVAAVRLLKPYLDDLIASVVSGVHDGRTLQQLRATIQLPAHAANPHYAARVAHIERVYRGLSLRQWSAQAAAGLSQMSEPAAYCPGYDPCDPPEGVLPSGTIGVGFSFGRVGFVAEADSGAQLFASRSSLFYDDIIANRRSRLSGLVRYRIGSATGSGIDLLGGVTWVSSDTQGLERIKEALPPLGGRHEIASRASTFGYTVGAELVLSVSGRWSLRTPARFTIAEDDELHPGRSDLRIGVGLAYHLTRRVAVRPGKPDPVVMRSTP